MDGRTCGDAGGKMETRTHCWNPTAARQKARSSNVAPPRRTPCIEDSVRNETVFCRGLDAPKRRSGFQND